MSEDLIAKLMSQIGDDVQKIYDHEALFKSAVARIRELEAENAALREARGVRVKDLDWEAFGTMAFVAQAPLFGRLRVEQFGRGNTWTVCFSVPGYCDTFLSGEWADADAAKDAAQADYERRILAALEPAPVTPAEAARVLRRFVYETTHLSRVEDDGSHWCRISKECLEGGRATLHTLADAGEAG